VDAYSLRVVGDDGSTHHTQAAWAGVFPTEGTARTLEVGAASHPLVEPCVEASEAVGKLGEGVADIGGAAEVEGVGAGGVVEGEVVGAYGPAVGDLGLDRGTGVAVREVQLVVRVGARRAGPRRQQTRHRGHH
jgi:hypothetical protein